MKLALFSPSVSLAALAALVAACGASPGGDEAVSATTPEAVTTGDVAGAYAGAPGSQFADVVFATEKNAAGQYPYFLEQSPELISCVVGTGCTITHLREDGHYSATATHVTLHPTNGPERVYGYQREGDGLTLTREGETGVFSEIPSYCDTASDCPGEGLIRPDCASATSGWECNAHACSYACSGAH
jgi:hypothetical protein